MSSSKNRRTPLPPPTIDVEVDIEEQVEIAVDAIDAACAQFPADVQSRALIRMLARIRRRDGQGGPTLRADQGSRVGSQESASAKSAVGSRFVATPPSLAESDDGQYAPYPSFKSRIIEILRKQPRLPVAQVAVMVYGEDSDQNRGRVRSLLAQAKRKRLVRTPRPGVWEVVGSR